MPENTLNIAFENVTDSLKVGVSWFPTLQIPCVCKFVYSLNSERIHEWEYSGILPWSLCSPLALATCSLHKRTDLSTFPWAVLFSARQLHGSFNQDLLSETYELCLGNTSRSFCHHQDAAGSNLDTESSQLEDEEDACLYTDTLCMLTGVVRLLTEVDGMPHPWP